MRLFRKKSKQAYVPLPVKEIGVDMHNHLLFGIDDGAKDLQVSMEMVKWYIDMGFKKVFASPHVMQDGFPNSPETILPKRDAIREEIKKQGLNLEVEAIAEYYLDDGFEEAMKKGEFLTFHSDFLLFETSLQYEYKGMRDIIFELTLSGYQPIWAHPERYFYMHPKKDEYFKVKEQGALFQLNLMSFAGQYGPEVKAMAEWMVANDLVDLVGTDAHHPKHLERLGSIEVPVKLAEKIKAGKLWNARL